MIKLGKYSPTLGGRIEKQFKKGVFAINFVMQEGEGVRKI